MPEATPVHEAAQLQKELERADIHPLAWVINQSLVPLTVTNPVLLRRRESEARFHAEVAELTARVVLVPWSDSEGARRFDVVEAASLGSPAEAGP